MHPAFECFEWGAFDVARPHPHGFPVHPDGPWSHAVLTLRRTGEEIGDAWYILEDNILTVLVQVADKNGGNNDPWLIRLVADTLFGEEGFTAGYYDEKAAVIRYRNIKTNGVWDGSLAEMRGASGSGAPDGGIK
ncbi:hypothetical protein AYO44_05110 [Planctomycetaceae bacterium SCGC AG-212-F19]|nr:hypothetical protein AYO44_05110 [Planctomycetaceae bacterium SCGC AG-212-F19]